MSTGNRHRVALTALAIVFVGVAGLITASPASAQTRCASRHHLGIDEVCVSTAEISNVHGETQVTKIRVKVTALNQTAGGLNLAYFFINSEHEVTRPGFRPHPSFAMKPGQTVQHLFHPSPYARPKDGDRLVGCLVRGEKDVACSLSIPY